MHTTPHFSIKKMSPQFLVTDLERSVEFYTKMLGFDIDFRYEDFYFGIIKDGFSIHLKSGKPSGENRERNGDNEDLDIIFSVDDLEAFYRELSRKHIEFVQPLREMPYGKNFTSKTRIDIELLL